MMITVHLLYDYVILRFLIQHTPSGNVPLGSVPFGIAPCNYVDTPRSPSNTDRWKHPHGSSWNLIATIYLIGNHRKL